MIIRKEGIYYYERRVVSMKNKLFSLLLIIVLCAGLLSGCNEAAATSNNLAEYAVEIKNAGIQPKGLEFGMSIEEVCKTKGLQINDQQFTSTTTSRIVRAITIEGLSDKIHEQFTFYKGKLIGVSYNALVDETIIEGKMEQLKAQTAAILPEAMNVNGYCWEDSNGMGVYIDYASTDNDSHPEVICFSVRRINSTDNSLLD